MFSKLVSRNSKRDRKNNGLYFSSMVLSIISFYIILSLSHQDVNPRRQRSRQRVERRASRNASAPRPYSDRKSVV